MKSQAVREDEAKQPQEDKLVSTVAAAAAARVIGIDDLVNANKPPGNSDTPTSPSDEPTSAGDPGKSEEKSEDKPASDNNGISPEEKPASPKEPDSLKEEGPVVEEIAEADRVRAELFNENLDQGVEAV